MNSSENSSFSIGSYANFNNKTWSSAPTPQYVINIDIAVSIVGTVGNTLSLIVSYKHKPLRKRLSNYYLINQMVVNLLASLLLVPSAISLNTYVNTAFCMLWSSSFINGSLYTLSIYSAVLLSAERYLQVVHPIKHRVNVTQKKVLISIVLTWIVVFVEKALFLVSPASSSNGVCTKSFGSQKLQIIAGSLNCVFDYIFPLVITALGYILMIRSLQNKVQSVSATSPKGSVAVPPTANDRMSRAKKNILVTLLLLLVCFVVCNSFKQALILNSLITAGQFPYDLFGIAQIMATLMAMIDPYICLFFLHEFRTGLFKLLHVPERVVSYINESKSGHHNPSVSHRDNNSVSPSVHYN